MLKRQLVFHSVHSTGWFLLCMAAVVAAVVLIAMLLRYERRLVPRRVGNTLFALRLVLIAVLFLTLLEPVLSWTLDREQTSRILVAIDLSESMSTTDIHAHRAEKLRWARALGMIGNPGIDARLDRWMKAFKEGREPVWVEDGESNDPERRRQLEQTRKQNLQEIFAGIDRLTRKEIALRLLSGTSSPLLPILQDVGNVDLLVFAGKAEAADEQNIEAIISQPPQSILTEVSDLSQALSSTTTDAQTSPLMGVILFTDGRDNSSRNVLRAAKRLGQVETPVYPVILGSESQPKDLAIASLDYPQTSFKGDHPLLKATLGTSGFKGEELSIVLQPKGKEPVTKTVTPNGPTTSVEFALDAEDVGRHEFTIRTEVRPGETREDNNSKTFAMNVVDDKVRVLLLEGEARWEFRYLDNALSRDERVDVKKVVYRQPYLGVLRKTFFPRSLELPADSDDLENSPFAEPDLVILGDISPADLPQAGWKLLEKFVSESGGTLVLIAGKRHFPLSYRSPIVDHLVPLTNLRPVNLTGSAALGPPNERGFHLRLTPEGALEPMFQFGVDAVENREIWAGLAGHTWGLLGQAKPGATVFAYALEPDVKPTLEAERRGAVIVHQHYGSGQVLWMGIDSTWRWRHLVGDKYHHRFWGQVGRWAADNKATAGNEFVKFGPERTDVEVGQDAIIRARWTRAFLRRFPKLKAEAKIFRTGDKPPTKPFAILPLVPAETRPLVHEARAVSLPAGDYRIKLVVHEADLGPEEISARLYVNEQPTLELSNLSSNRELLTQLADASHGELFYPDELQKLSEQFQNPQLSSTIHQEIALWDHWLILLLFFGLLTAEWVIRKLNGLP